MNINDITPAFFDTCCAYFRKDAAANFVNQGRCTYPAKAVVLGTTEYGRLFTKSGDGNTVVGLCKTHLNVLDRQGVINVNETFIDPTKENTMNNNTSVFAEVADTFAFADENTVQWDYENDCDDDNEGTITFQGKCDYCETEGLMRYGYSARASDGVKVPVITHCALGCPMDQSYMAEGKEVLLESNMADLEDAETGEVKSKAHPFKCGKCHKYHDTTARVAQCYNVVQHRVSRDTWIADQMAKSSNVRKISNPFKGR